ncbi:hypothetical protein BUALT_Bualt11G0120100 [Buddleja alternifolia]|uniref:Pectin acetylesterase n=1 Tax=Buddleja alternifolia TaxID=168488 RepID=A0AAV6X303_9LAMI|nr:hypothetical protein BUALT_Bualt11G0120100 [Buddleja alternifolia]
MPANQQRLQRSAADGAVSWWRRRKLSKREWTIAASAASALSVFILILSPISVSRTFVNTNANTDRDTNVDTSSGTGSEWVPFTPLSKAQENSAFCLDGSVPGYHMRRGFGSGSDSWLLHVEGGGWCSTISSCSARRRTKLGSSSYMDREVQFAGILSHNPLQNPDFFNWNKVKIRYCDGSSFASHPDSEFKNGSKIFFRGQLIWDTLMDELLSIGMSKSREAFLTGCSAGGLATLIHCDDFRDLLPKNAIVKCLADAERKLSRLPVDSFMKDLAGNRTLESFYHDVVHLQGVAKSLNHDCVTRSEPSKCFFPREFIGSIKTPVFLVQPAYDFWQIANILVPDVSDPHDSWLRCKLNIFNCDSSQLEVLHANVHRAMAGRKRKGGRPAMRPEIVSTPPQQFSVGVAGLGRTPMGGNDLGESRGSPNINSIEQLLQSAHQMMAEKVPAEEIALEMQMRLQNLHQSLEEAKCGSGNVCKFLFCSLPDMGG